MVLDCVNFNPSIPHATLLLPKILHSRAIASISFSTMPEQDIILTKEFSSVFSTFRRYLRPKCRNRDKVLFVAPKCMPRIIMSFSPHPNENKKKSKCVIKCTRPSNFLLLIAYISLFAMRRQVIVDGGKSLQKILKTDMVESSTGYQSMFLFPSCTWENALLSGSWIHLLSMYWWRRQWFSDLVNESMPIPRWDSIFIFLTFQ